MSLPVIPNAVLHNWKYSRNYFMSSLTFWLFRLGFQTAPKSVSFILIWLLVKKSLHHVSVFQVERVIEPLIISCIAVMIRHFSCTKCREVVALFRTPAHSVPLTAVPFNIMGASRAEKGGEVSHFCLTGAPPQEPLNALTFHFGSDKSEHLLQFYL